METSHLIHTPGKNNENCWTIFQPATVSRSFTKQKWREHGFECVFDCVSEFPPCEFSNEKTLWLFRVNRGLYYQFYKDYNKPA